MVKMPAEVRRILERPQILPLATASAEGEPNVVYIGVLKVADDETLVLADNYFLKTAANMEKNPWVALVCWDPEAKESYQIKGWVLSMQEVGDVYDDMAKTVSRLNDRIKVRRAVVVRVTEVYNAMGGPGAGERIA